MSGASSRADRLREIGKAVHQAATADVGATLNSGFAEFIKFPFSCSPGKLIDSAGSVSDHFACVVHAARSGVATGENIPADNACAVIDQIEDLDLNELRSAHARCLAVKRLQRAELPKDDKTPVAQMTMTVIYARRAGVSIDVLADEFRCLNEGLEHSDWIEMVAVSAIAVISYACQFAGRSELGGMFSPAKGAKDSYSPACYTIPTMMPSKDGTFNKIISFISAYTVFYYPGVRVDGWQELMNGVCQTAITLPGYQYNVSGDIRPVPPEHYVGRLMLPRPYLVESAKPKELLATLNYLPWQDGGVILLKGKLPLEGLMIFLGKDALKKGGTIRSGPQSQESYVLPITPADFALMMTRLRNQSNMIVRREESKFVMEKMADEGTRTPFMARIFMGLLQLRDTAFRDLKERQQFDALLDQALTPLMAARTAAKEIEESWRSHSEAVASGAAVKVKDGTVEVVGDFYRGFRREVNTFLYDAAKALKEGGQKVGTSAGKDIGFMFQKENPYQKGLAAMRATDPVLAAYMEATRNHWSQRLIKARNDLDPNGWTLPRVRYEPLDGQRVVAHQPLIDGQPTIEFVTHMLDRVSCFVEEFFAYCFRTRFPKEIDLTEIPLSGRPAHAPERFRITLKTGGLPSWELVYPTRKFEDL